MKILLAAPQDRTVLGAIGSDCRDTLAAMGHSVFVFDYRARPYAAGALYRGLRRVVRAALPRVPSPYDLSASFRSRVDGRVNRSLEKCAADLKPDLLLVLCGETIRPQTLGSIRSRLGIPVVNWFHDTLLLPYRRQLLQEIAAAYDIVFIVDAQEVLKAVPLPAARFETLPLACNPRVHKRMELSARERSFYGSDIAFVGTVTPQRQEWLETLADHDLKIWGRWEGRSARLQRCYRRQNVYGAEAVKIYNASRIVLDFHSLWGSEKALYNVTPRVFEVPACGGFLLTNDCLQLPGLYRIGQEMAVYHDIEEMKRLVRFYLDNESQRLSLADAAWRRAHECHTLEHRLAALLQRVRSVG